MKYITIIEAIAAVLAPIFELWREIQDLGGKKVFATLKSVYGRRYVMSDSSPAATVSVR